MSDSEAESFVICLPFFEEKLVGICQNVSYFIVSKVHPCIFTCNKRVHEKKVNVLIHEKRMHAFFG